MFGGLKKVVFLQPQIERFSVAKRGALAQLARALAWHARGHRFDSVMLHIRNPAIAGFFICQQHKRFPSGMELIRLINQRRLVTYIVVRKRYLPPL